MQGGDGGDGSLFNIDSEFVIFKVTCTRAHTCKHTAGAGHPFCYGVRTKGMKT